MRMLTMTSVAAIAVASGAVWGQAIDPVDKYAWSENAGWINFADAAIPVTVEADHLAGYAWSENTGYIDLGAGGPYANTGGLDFGVNRDAGTGELSGFGWSENTGWINFSGGALASPANPARVDSSAGRLRGYAWSENMGWVNLDDAVAFVGFSLPCVADVTTTNTNPGDTGYGQPDGVVDGADLSYFVENWLSGSAAVADVTTTNTNPGDAAYGQPDGVVDGADLSFFVERWLAGCP